MSVEEDIPSLAIGLHVEQDSRGICEKCWFSHRVWNEEEKAWDYYMSREDGPAQIYSFSWQVNNVIGYWRKGVQVVDEE